MTTTFALLFASLTLPLNAQVVSPDISPENTGTISVLLADEAKGACWTNLREAREYAEEKLASKKYDIVADAGDYAFVIMVQAFRSSAGGCIYHVEASVEKTIGYQPDQMYGRFIVGISGYLGTANENANTKVIETIQDLVGQM